MADKPILFSGPMVRALLDGRKMQTRRVLKPQPQEDARFRGIYAPGLSAVFGDPECPRDDDLSLRLHSLKTRLWVRETWRPSISAADPWHVAVVYPHDGQVKHWDWSSDADFGDWKMPKAAATGNVSPLFMPRWASRLTLIVTDVRVQRLQDISHTDAIAEGITQTREGNFTLWQNYMGGSAIMSPVQSFRSLWDSIHGPDAWDANPWVAAYTFTVHKQNIDQMGAQP